MEWNESHTIVLYWNVGFPDMSFDNKLRFALKLCHYILQWLLNYLENVFISINFLALSSLQMPPRTRLHVQLSHGAESGLERTDWKPEKLQSCCCYYFFFIKSFTRSIRKPQRNRGSAIHRFYPKTHTFANHTLALTQTRSPVLFFLRGSAVVDKRVAFQRFQHFHCIIPAEKSPVKKFALHFPCSYLMLRPL